MIKITKHIIHYTSFLIACLIATFICFQNTEKINEDDLSFNDEDLEYEMKHKSQPWFSNMKDGANYFEVKNNFDTYFGNHRWEKSKPRALGESWIKTKLFYLDNNGNVQAEPKPTIQNSFNSPLNTINSSSTSVIGSWTLLGPVNSATTSYSGKGSHGGYVFLNRIDPTNKQKMFVSFVTGGLWMTANGGINWTLVDSNLPDDTYYDLDVAISNPQIVYAISKQQVIKSIDGGLNWVSTNLTNSSYSGTAYDIAVSTANPNIVVARWGNNIYRTTDGGTNWATVQTGLSNHQTWGSSLHSEMLDWSTTNSNVVYALSTSHNNQVTVYLSNNAGASFSAIKTITLSTSANGQVVGWAKLLLPTSNTNSIYIAVGSGENASAHRAVHLYKLNATYGNIENTRVNMISGIGDPSNHDPVLHHGDISMDRNNENKIIYGSYAGRRIFISTNNGYSFSLSNSSMHSDIRSVDCIDNYVFTGNDGESTLSKDNGVNFQTVTNSISNHELWGFGSAFKTDLVASGNNHGPVMIKESGNGFDWYNGPGADQGNTDVNPLDDRYIYSNGYSNYRYFRTGVHQLVNQSNLLDNGGIYAYFNSMEFHPNNYYTIITHHAGQYPNSNPNLSTWKNSLIKTEDNGNTITVVKTFTDQVFREKISMKNPDHMYVVVGKSNNRLWHTADAGITWTDITPSTTASSGQKNISDIAVGDENPNEIWVTYSGVQSVCKILKSSNYGANWTNLTQANLSNFPITKIIFQRGSNGGVYLGSKKGVFYRNNTMPNWMLLGSGLPMSDIRFMFINYNQGKLKIGTSRGAFTHNLYETSPPNALISASTSKKSCTSLEKIQFKDYSVVRNASATWSWSFPGGTPATSTEENPEVSYKNAPNGFYDVTLTVTDAYGTSTQTLTNFIEVTGNCTTDSDNDSIPDYEENSQCTNTIPQKNLISGSNTDVITDFNGAMSGIYYADVTIFTSCYSKTATVQAEVNLNTNVIVVKSYSHFNSKFTTDPISGSGTTELISGSGDYAKIGFKLVVNTGSKQLVFNHINNACGSVARINTSCWDSLDYDNDGTLNYLDTDSDNDGISDYNESTICVNAIPQGNTISGGNTDLITNFNGANSGIYFTTVNIFANCYSTTATLKVRVNLNTSALHVVSYSHFNSTSLTDSISGNGSKELISDSNLYAKIGIKLIAKQLIFNLISNACGSTARVNPSCWSNLDSDFNGKIDYLDSQLTLATPASNQSVACNSSTNQTELQQWLNTHGGAIVSGGCSAITWTNNYTGLSNGPGATGEATVTFTATDTCGNKKVTIATFSIIDTTNPTWSTVPQDLTVQCDSGTDPLALYTNWLNSFNGTDSCGIANTTNNSTGFTYDCGNIGSKTVLFTLTDDNGNAISKEATFSIQKTLGVDELDITNLKVFPNPTIDNFTVSFELESNEKLSLNLYDTLGRIIESKVFENNLGGIFIETFDCKHLKSGMYYLSIRNENKRVIKNIIIK